MKYLTLFLLLIISPLLFAQQERYVDVIEEDDVYEGGVYFLTDNKISQIGQSLFSTESTLDYVELGYADGISNSFTGYYKLEVDVALTGYDENGNSTSIGNETLVIEYLETTNNVDTKRDAFTFNGYPKIKVEITDIRYDDGSATQNFMPDNTYLKLGIDQERYYDLDVNQVPGDYPHVFSHRLTDEDNSSVDDHVEFFWGYIEGAVYYELEWAYVEAFDVDGSLKSPNNVDFSTSDFRWNSTRIQTTDQSYKMPLVFEEGYLVYRLRAVGFNGGSYEYMHVGNWSTENLASQGTTVSNFPNYFSIDANTAHESALNWQYTATFAEDGKRKEVISYYDGSLRNRQTVTLLNTTDEAVVGQQIYDGIGRKAIDVLPTPAGENVIKYYEDFNTVAGSPTESYSYKDFDMTDQTNLGSCVTVTVGAMNNASGAEKYYSSNANQRTTAHNYIPQAGGYPFVQTVYTPDNTGRVRQQSGVGEDFLTTGEHATRYFYAQPYQEELDRIFGANVGNKKHYQKNMVVDANGQVSVSYKDPQGRVIATALAGESPDNLVALEDENGNPLDAGGVMTVDLLSKVDLDDDGTVTDEPDSDLDDNNLNSTNGYSVNNQLVFSTEEAVVQNSSSYTFDYDITSDGYTDACLDDGQTQTYYPYIYDLDISVTNDCDQTPLVDEQQIIQPTDADIPNGNYGTPPSVQSPDPLTFNATLGIGTFSINKTLTVNKEAVDHFAEQYILDGQANGCIKTYQDFLNDELAAMETEGCAITCDECLTDLGSEADFVIEMFAQYNINNVTSDGNGGYNDVPTEEQDRLEEFKDMYQTELDLCNRLCENTYSLCEAMYFQMKHDVSPGGQYGATSGDMSLSVFKTNNDLLSGVHWQNPSTPYLDENGSAAKVLLYEDPNTSSGYAPDVVSVGLVDQTPNGFYTTPDNLANLEDFLDVMEEQWAESLIAAHPEYCYYDWCTGPSEYGETTTIDNEDLTSEDIDNLLLPIETYADASTSDVLGTGVDLLDFTDLITVDPYFDAGYATTLTNRLTNYYDENSTVLDVLEFSIYMKTEGFIPGTLPNSTPNYYTFSYPGLTTAQKDEIWQMYRSLVMSEKQQLRTELAHTYAQNQGCYNGCIGSTDEEQSVTFQPEEENYDNVSFWDVTGFFPPSVSTPNDPQPCDFTNYGDYGDKTPIWFAGSDLASNQGGEDANLENLFQNSYNQIYDATGQCPLAFDLQGLLNAIISDDALSSSQLTSSSVDLALKPYVAYNLQDALGMLDGSYPPTPQNTFYYDASITSTTELSIDLGESTSPCVTTLTLPNYTFASNNLDWNDYLSTWTINNLALLSFTSESNGVYSFTIQAWVDRDLNDATNPNEAVVISGETCLMIGECEVATNPSAENEPGELLEVCELNENGEGLLDLLIQLHATTQDGLDPTPTVDLSSNNFENNVLLIDYGTDWDLTSFSSGSDYTFTPSTGTALDLHIDWGVNDPSLVTEIQGLTVHDDQSFSLHVNKGAVGVWDPADCYTVTGYLTESGSSTNIALGSCDACSTDGVTLTENLRSHVIEYLQGSTTFAQNIKDYFNENSLSTANDVYEMGSLTYDITNDAGQALCNVEITSSPAIDFQNASYTTFGTSAIPVPGSPNSFTFEAMLSDGSWITLTVTTCIEVETCPCTPEAPQPTSCEEEYAQYESAMTTYGGEYSNFALSYSDFCDGNYSGFLSQYLAYLASLDNISATMPYVSFDDYIGCQQDEWMQFSMTDAYDDYLTQLDNNPNNLLTVPYSEFEIVGDCDYCLDLYEQYLENNAGSLTQANRLSMMEICGEPQVCPAGISNGDPNLGQTEEADLYDCEDFLNDVAVENAQGEYEAYINELTAEFKANYITGALEDAVENFTMDRPDNEYQYTLFYYDQAGNRVRTVPPKGVNRMDINNANWANDFVAIGSYRANDYDPAVGYSTAPSGVLPSHTHVTTYAYNALNQLVWQETPDGGESYFWYDALGRLIASQNAEQALTDDFSYTKHDELGRVVEVGALEGASGDVSNGELTVDVDANNYPDNWSSTRYEVTKTIYDDNIELATANPLVFRNRIGSVIQQESLDSDNNVYRSAYHYEYDVHGNVKWMQQDYRTNVEIDESGLSATTEYQYDLISGNVLEVEYKTPSEKDLMIHRYFYDADNRIVDVETSQDGFYYNTDAHYIYYDHGPLARVELANEKVQGTDFAYTIQGWQKVVNAAKLDDVLDMGKDGADETFAPGGNNYNAMTGKDAYGFALTYYNDNSTELDYEQIKTTTWTPDPMADLNTSRPVGTNGLYNGNIAQMSTAMMDDNEQIIPLISNDYTYDQLQRIKSMTSHESGTTVGTDYDYASATGNTYAATYSFDANGNLSELTRKNGAGTLIDDFTYNYVNGGVDNNKLDYVADPAGSSGNDLASQSTGNYTYNANGQLTKDIQEEINTISWTTAGKVKYIQRESTSDKSDVFFTYDPMGNRVAKEEKTRTGSGYAYPNQWNRTIYMRDAQGNVMATYDMVFDIRGSNVAEMYSINELNIYGSSRLGQINVDESVAERVYAGYYGDITDEDPASTATTVYENPATDDEFSDKRGQKYFELSNHLNNVLEVITDRKLPEPDGSQIKIEYYVADVVSYSDYYPYGMLMDGRKGSTPDYRYGFQGQEKDDEVKGEGNSINYKYRMHDPRIGRFFAVDPLTAKYPHYTPYSFSGNKVIHAIELEGAEELKVNDLDPMFKPALKLNLPNGGAVTVYKVHNIYVISGDAKRKLQRSGVYGGQYRAHDYAYGGMNGSNDMTQEGAKMSFQIGGITVTSDYPKNQYITYHFTNPGKIEQTYTETILVPVRIPGRPRVPAVINNNSGTTIGLNHFYNGNNNPASAADRATIARQSVIFVGVRINMAQNIGAANPNVNTAIDQINVTVRDPNALSNSAINALRANYGVPVVVTIDPSIGSDLQYSVDYTTTTVVTPAVPPVPPRTVMQPRQVTRRRTVDAVEEIPSEGSGG